MLKRRYCSQLSLLSHSEGGRAIIGISRQLRRLTICHCYQDNDEVIRIISARKATHTEQEQYDEQYMRDEYDFSNTTRNPYIKKLKKPVTIRSDGDVIAYFKNLSAEKGIPYQSLINLYLMDCVRQQREPNLTWASPA